MDSEIQEMDEGVSADFFTMIKIARWNYVGIPFMDFLLPYFSRAVLGASATELGIMVSLSMLGIILSSAIFGNFIKIIGSKRLMAISSLVRGCAYLLMYFGFICYSTPIIMVGSLIKGICAGSYEVAYDVLVADKSHKSQRSFAYGNVVSSRGVAFFIGGGVGIGLYGILHSLTPLISVQLIPMILIALAMFWASIQIHLKFQYAGKNPETVSPELSIFSENLSVGSISKANSILTVGSLLLFISLFLSNLNDSLTFPFIQVYLLDVLHSSFFIVLFAYAPGGVISFLIAPQIGKIVDKINPYVGITIVSLAGAALTWWLINVSSIWMFGLIFLLDRGFALTGALLVKNIISRLSITHRGKNLGYALSIGNLGSIIGPSLGGILWDNYSPQLPFILSIFIELALIMFYIVGLRSGRDQMAEKMDRL